MSVPDFKPLKTNKQNTHTQDTHCIIYVLYQIVPPKARKYKCSQQLWVKYLKSIDLSFLFSLLEYFILVFRAKLTTQPFFLDDKQSTLFKKQK